MYQEGRRENFLMIGKKKLTEKNFTIGFTKKVKEACIFKKLYLNFP